MFKLLISPLPPWWKAWWQVDWHVARKVGENSTSRYSGNRKFFHDTPQMPPLSTNISIHQDRNYFVSIIKIPTTSVLSVTQNVFFLLCPWYLSSPVVMLQHFHDASQMLALSTSISIYNNQYYLFLSLKSPLHLCSLLHITYSS